MQVIANNLLSQYACRQINTSTKKTAKSRTKLATGFRINQAADDAAGLQISEKMRWLIRGLNKSEQNIQEGVSLIKTADGALDEVTSVLQRVRELSVQAYNDTNTESDRKAIQQEVDESLAEINRIGETTTFNTIKILKGNPSKTVKVSKNMNVEYTTTMQLYKTAPDWLSNKMDLTMEKHSAYSQNQPDRDGIMLQRLDDGRLIYYGSKHPDKAPHDAIWYGDTAEGIAAGYTGWSATLSDNPTAKLDFSGLCGSSDAMTLYDNLFNLLGTQITYPCGTCSYEKEGLSFVGSENSLTVSGFEIEAGADEGTYGTVDLSNTDFTYNGKTYSGYFESIRDLMESHQTDDTKDETTKSTETKSLAESIAKDLAKKSGDALGKSLGNHFDCVTMAEGNPYSLIVYDYRDNNSLTSLTAADSTVKTGCKVNYEMSSSYVKPGDEIEVKSPLMIMAGAQSDDGIDINLPDISITELGLEGYSVGNYSILETYSTSYQDKLDEWKRSGYTDRLVTSTSYEKKVTSFTPGIFGYKNGEAYKWFRNPKAEYEEIPITTTKTERVYDPKPEPQKGEVTRKREYTPSSLKLVDDALDKVLRKRSELGATQNRLEHAYNVNSIDEENTQAAESTIRDTDIAEEMVENTKSNILTQAAQAMMTQANQQQEMVLRLLQ